MRHIRTLALVGLTISVVGACASAGEGTGSSTPRGSRNRIVRAELEGTSFSSVMDAVRRLRSTWLRPRGQTATGERSVMFVYIDNVRSGDLTRLESIPIDRVDAVVYLSPPDATMRFGTNHALGAIEVIMRRGN